MADPAPDLQLTTFLRFFVKENPKSGDPMPWLKGGARPKAIVEAILAAPLFAGLKVGRADDAKLAALTPAKAAAMVGTGREVAADFKDRKDDEQLDVNVDLRDDRFEVRLIASGAALTANRKTAIDDLVAAAHAIWKAVKDVAGLQSGHIQVGAVGGVYEYPRPRPPRDHGMYPARSLVTFIDPAYHGSGHALASPDEAKALTTPPPPAPAKVTTDGGLVTVRWVKSLDDDLAAAAGGSDAWIGERLEPEPLSGYNELGDFQDDLEGATRSPPLTFYQREYEMGYKTVVVFPDGTVDQSAWADAKKVLKAKKLPDGSPVDGVRLIVPLRELVFAIKDKATTDGFDAVLYPDDQGNFWDPDPPGLWVGPPRQPKASKSKEKAEKPKSKRK